MFNIIIHFDILRIIFYLFHFYPSFPQVINWWVQVGDSALAGGCRWGTVHQLVGAGVGQCISWWVPLGDSALAGGCRWWTVHWLVGAGGGHYMMLLDCFPIEHILHIQITINESADNSHLGVLNRHSARPAITVTAFVSNLFNNSS